MNPKFYQCDTCKNLVHLIDEGGGTLVCCGNDMKELIANTVEASVEKHLPAVSFEDTTLMVDVGSVAHPMVPEHFISFIYVQTQKGGQLHRLEIGSEPSARFAFIDDKPVAVYAYCNIHGMWKTEL